MNRNSIIKHIELWKSKLGSMNKVAEKCGISGTALSLLISGKYGAKETALLQTIASALNYKEADWQLVRTIGNYTTVQRIVDDAKQESMWFAISNKAGSGKTGTLEDIFNQDTTGSIVFIQAERWTERQFLTQLALKTIGENALKGKYKSNGELGQKIADFFNEKQADKPILFIDEADKLKPLALGSLIPMFNKTEDRLAVIISGTENLEKDITTGVRLKKKNYDEIESRIGRSYQYLRGATEKEVYQICEANGVTNEFSKINIWSEIEKVQKMVTVKTQKGEKEIVIEFAEDFRRLKRLIKRERLLNRNVA
jgi:transcriptional regulator with XRE-family HTH domain